MIDRLNPTHREIIFEAQRELPVRVGDIARRLGLPVRASTLPAGISGEIRPAGGSFEIKVNRHESRGRQRFTVAHELGRIDIQRIQSMDAAIWTKAR